MASRYPYQLLCIAERERRSPAEIIDAILWLKNDQVCSNREAARVLSTIDLDVNYESLRRWIALFPKDELAAVKRRKPFIGEKWRDRLYEVWEQEALEKVAERKQAAESAA